MYRVMTVCHGNICRSPMAEIVLRDAFERAGLGDQVQIDSTGVSGEEAGNPIDRRARAVLESHGYDVPRHVARRIRPSELNERDLVLPATYAQWRDLHRLAGHDASAGIVMLREFDPRFEGRDAGHDLDLDDPWYGTIADFDTTLAEIEAATPSLVEYVRQCLAGDQGHDIDATVG